jgi:hypothetical protein
MQSSSFGIVGVLFLFLALKAFETHRFIDTIGKEKARSPLESKRASRYLILHKSRKPCPQSGFS